MKELKRLNPSKSGVASDEMCTFVVLNTASIQLVPATIIAMRQTAGSANPFEIIIPVILCSTLALVIGMISNKIFAKQR